MEVASQRSAFSAWVWLVALHVRGRATRDPQRCNRLLRMGFGAIPCSWSPFPVPALPETVDRRRRRGERRAGVKRTRGGFIPQIGSDAA